MLLRRQKYRRRGLSLLEVILAMAIFLLSMVAISQMVESAARRGIRSQLQSKAALLAESRMNEIVAGVIPLDFSPGDLPVEAEVPFDPEDEEDPHWRCIVVVETPPYGIDTAVPLSPDYEVAGLMQVTVRVGWFYQGATKPEVEYVLSRLVLNPQLRIPLPDPPSASGSSAAPASPGAPTPQ